AIDKVPQYQGGYRCRQQEIDQCIVELGKKAKDGIGGRSFRKLIAAVDLQSPTCFLSRKPIGTCCKFGQHFIDVLSVVASPRAYGCAGSVLVGIRYVSTAVLRLHHCTPGSGRVTRLRSSLS